MLCSLGKPQSMNFCSTDNIVREKSLMVGSEGLESK